MPLSRVCEGLDFFKPRTEVCRRAILYISIFQRRGWKLGTEQSRRNQRRSTVKCGGPVWWVSWLLLHLLPTLCPHLGEGVGEEGERIPMSCCDSMQFCWCQQIFVELINECQGRPKGKRHRARVPKREMKVLVEEEQSGEPWLGWHKTLILQNA